MQAISFEAISEQQQTEVLRYLEATNSEDIQAATEILQQHQFDAQAAISQHFSSPGAGRPAPRQHSEEQQRELAQYVRHLQRVLQRRTVWRLLTATALGLLRSCLRGLSQYLLPECLKSRLRSKFGRLYRAGCPVRFEETSLEDVLQKGRLHDKPCALLLSNPQRPDAALMEALTSNEVSSLLVLPA